MATWFKSKHGTPTQRIWLAVARRATVKPYVVSAIAWALLDSASQNQNRGSITEFDAEDYSAFSGLDEDTVNLVLATMQDMGIIDKKGKWSTWDKEQGTTSPRPSAEVWAKIRASVFHRDNYTCQYCGKRGVTLECDHVTPVSRGGSNDASNLVTACRKCNRAKRAKTLEEWAR